QRELLQDLGREPTPEELAKEMDITPDKVLEIQQYAREPISLDLLLEDEETATRIRALIDDGERLVRMAFEASALHALSSLPAREAAVLRMRFGFDSYDPMTLEEIGAEFGVTRERIRQLEVKSLKFLAAKVERDLSWRVEPFKVATPPPTVRSMAGYSRRHLALRRPRTASTLSALQPES
ncbi:sigma factor-like helix-turn-helix DNA-binding protein, partial [Geodermatophilus sp. SYSU D00705]